MSVVKVLNLQWCHKIKFFSVSSLQLFTGQKKQPVIVPMYAASLVSLTPPTFGKFSLSSCRQTSADPVMLFQHQLPEPLNTLQIMHLAFFTQLF